jgi:hypothetical protein
LSRKASIDPVISLGVAPLFVEFSLICYAVWTITPCNVVRETFEGKYCFHLQGRRISLWHGLWNLWYFCGTSTAYLSPTTKRLRFPFNATGGLVVCLRRVQFALLCTYSQSLEAWLSSSISFQYWLTSFLLGVSLSIQFTGFFNIALVVYDFQNQKFFIDCLSNTYIFFWYVCLAGSLL